MRKSLRELMDDCGAVRNCDIAEQVLEAAGKPAADSILRRLRKERVRAEGSLSRVLTRWQTNHSYRKWRSYLRLQTPGHEDIAKQILAPQAREFFRVGSNATKAHATAHEMHQFRLVAKRLRYALELFRQTYGPEWDRGIEELRGLQDRLGAINDCAATRDLLDEIGKPGAKLRVIKAALRHLQRERIAEFRTYWRGTFSSKNRKWWLQWVATPTNKRREK
jgi:CHAD domain-containing protein